MTCFDNNFDVFEFNSNGDSSESTRDWSSPPQPSLAQLLAPTQITLARRGESEWSLQVRPVPGIAVLEQWRREAFRKPLACLALRVEPARAEVAAGSSSVSASVSASVSSSAASVRCSVVHKRRSLIDVLGDGGDDDRVIALIDGPVEEADIRAVAGAVQRGQSPLDVELRAEAALHIRPGRTLTLETRDEDAALRLAAEVLRQHLATLRRRPAREFGAPQTWQMQRLLGVTGTLSVQPIETEVFSTAIDVGISTAPLSEPRPADRSLIYDIFSRTWHDEP